MKNLLKISFTFFLLVVAISTFGKNQGNCAKCKEILVLKDQYTKLKYFDETDLEAGAKDLNKVLGFIDNFGASKQKNEAELKALVLLTAEALPYDPEKVLSFKLSEVVSASPSLQKTFATASEQIKEGCRKTLFLDQIKAYTCSENIRGGVGVNAKGNITLSCDSKFDFEKCLKK